jgi:hypothetical protein
MTYFLFAGDMLVMAFMVGLVVWVSLKSSREVLEESAAIPLHDEIFLDDHVAGASDALRQSTAAAHGESPDG